MYTVHALICPTLELLNDALFVYNLLAGEVDAIQKQIDVLVSGVIWTFKAFQTHFLKQNEPCALVATSSLAGVFPAHGSYGVGKHAAVAVMEALHMELQQKGKSVTCHVLCPGVVSTGIGQNSAKGADSPTGKATLEKIKLLPFKKQMAALATLAFQTILEEEGMPASLAADLVWDAISTGKFYIIMDHGDPRFSVHATEMIAHRHRRIESGAPVDMGLKKPGFFLGGGVVAVVVLGVSTK
jgi:NAD(P)-dependent dehydrogenase (short-subunit alcohol dehydrogenase family)